jgi:hypothetical protein
VERFEFVGWVGRTVVDRSPDKCLLGEKWMAKVYTQNYSNDVRPLPMFICEEKSGSVEEETPSHFQKKRHRTVDASGGEWGGGDMNTLWMPQFAGFVFVSVRVECCAA